MHYGPEVYSACNRNESQESSMGGKVQLIVRLTVLQSTVGGPTV
jgi:hypothetical protein